MLKVPQLDDLTYEQLVNRAISRIPTMTDQWTDFNSHDPGITVLQTYAWLVDMLHYYMSATGDVHVKKYLKLLGMEPKPAGISESYVVLEGYHQPISLQAGTSFYAGEVPFELAEDTVCVYNRFCSYIQETDAVGMDLTAFAGSDGDYIEVFAEQFADRSIAYFGFEQPLQDGDKLYLEVQEEKRRNLFGQDFRLCELVWEYYTGSGWKPLEVTDGTCGFLKQGFLEVHISEEMQAWNHPDGLVKAYYIRCVLLDNRYDSMPRIGRIYVNPLHVLQKVTVCREGDRAEQMVIGSTDGCAGQQVVFDYPDAWHFSLMLFAEEEEHDSCELWKMAASLEEADYTDKVFTYDPELKLITFGDGIHGMVPLQGMRICVTGLELSRLEQGNVLAGEIRESTCEALAGVTMYNPVASVGGRAQESLQEMLERLEETLFAQNRMASEEDYEKIILSTPGLMLDLVHVIPGRRYGELYRQDRGLNEIMAVVKPYGKSPTPRLSEAYRRMIEQYIEAFRLINTKVSIVSPVYVGIEVSAEIVLQTDTSAAREKVKQRISELVDYRWEERPFGKLISYGRLFTSLESMEEVKQVRGLSLEKNGVAAVKNDRGDILCQEDALSYVEKLQIEFRY